MRRMGKIAAAAAGAGAVLLIGVAGPADAVRAADGLTWTSSTIGHGDNTTTTADGLTWTCSHTPHASGSSGPSVV